MNNGGGIKEAILKGGKLNVNSKHSKNIFKFQKKLTHPNAEPLVYV